MERPSFWKFRETTTAPVSNMQQQQQDEQSSRIQYGKANKGQTKVRRDHLLKHFWIPDFCSFFLKKLLYIGGSDSILSFQMQLSTFYSILLANHILRKPSSLTSVNKKVSFKCKWSTPHTKRIAYTHIYSFRIFQSKLHTNKQTKAK